MNSEIEASGIVQEEYDRIRDMSDNILEKFTEKHGETEVNEFKLWWDSAINEYRYKIVAEKW